MLLDPYAKAIVGRLQWRAEIFGYRMETGDDLPSMSATALLSSFRRTLGHQPGLCESLRPWLEWKLHRVFFPALSHSGRSQIPFATTEFDDLIKVGGLGTDSSVLPWALSRWCDVRVLGLGYRQMLPHLEHMKISPAASLSPGFRAVTSAAWKPPDGLIVYALLCSSFYDRESTRYGDSQFAAQ